MQDITKNGETWLQMAVCRTKNGIELEVKAHPLIEEYFHKASGGRTMPLEGYAKEVYSPRGTELPVYHCDIMAEGRQRDAMFYFGGFNEMFYNNGEGANLCFLKLKGISEGIGVSIGMKQPMSKSALQDYKAMVGKAVKGFCREFLVPVKIRLMVVSMGED